MEPLADPCEDRFVKDVPAPPHQYLSEELLFPRKSKRAV